MTVETQNFRNTKYSYFKFRSQYDYSYLYCEIKWLDIKRKALWLYRNIEARSHNRYCSAISICTERYECVSKFLGYLCSKNNPCAVLYCHLCPVTLYHIILPSLSCHAVPYYIAISAQSRCTILYCHLCPLTLYHIILPSLPCHAVPYYISISALSRCTIFSHIIPYKTRFSTKKWAQNMCFDFLYTFVWNMSLSDKIRETLSWMYIVVHGIYVNFIRF